MLILFDRQAAWRWPDGQNQLKQALALPDTTTPCYPAPRDRLIFEYLKFIEHNRLMKKTINTLYLLFAALYLFAGLYLVAPYLDGLVGGSDKEKANGRVRSSAANTGYVQELRGQLDRETDPVRLQLLKSELQRLTTR